jgi:hypothetical protein
LSDDEKPTVENGGLEIVPPFEKRLTKSQKVAYEFYNRLGITGDDVREQVLVTAAFKPFGEGSNGQAIAIEYLRASESKSAKKFLEVYDDATQSERDALTFEEFAAAAKVKSNILLGDIVAASATLSDATAKITALLAQQEIVASTVARAKTDAGIKEKEIILKHTGFIPSPKGGPQVNVQLNNNVNNQAKEDSYLPPMDVDIRDLSEKFQRLPNNKGKLLEGK